MLKRLALTLALGGAVLAGAAWADEVSVTGRVRVVDGDTLAMGPLRIRLNGIDAAEIGQTCRGADGRDWDCATAAVNRLEGLVSNGAIDCLARDQDVYGRIVATCRADGVDVGRVLVAEGLAWAFVRYSRDYVAEQEQAQASQVGIWQGEAEAPWDYRENRWARAAAASPRPGCPIKGNISVGSGERIYHTPWSASYAQTRIDLSKGERWFCDEAEAIAAGWRPARSR